MASQFQLVSAIIARAVSQADIEGQDDRWTAAKKLEQFNASASELRVRLANLGFDSFFERVDSTLPTTAAATNETYAEIDWPKDAMRIYGVHVFFGQDPGWLPLDPTSITGLRDYQRKRHHWYSYGITAQEPCAFALRKAPFGAASVETVGKIMITPVPRIARAYCLFYLQNYQPQVTTDTFNGHANFIEWIVQDMVVKFTERDNDSQETFQIAAGERARLEQLFAAEAPKRSWR